MFCFVCILFKPLSIQVAFYFEYCVVWGVVTYLAMDEEQTEVYDDLKGGVAGEFNISPETYLQRFRSPTVPAGESPNETYHQLKNLHW